MANACVIVRSNGEKMQAKVHRLHQVHHGDHIIKDTSGGGGVGRPEERDPQAVWEDVYINEFITIETARDVYKVVIDLATREIDWAQTQDAARGCAVLTFEGMAGSSRRVRGNHKMKNLSNGNPLDLRAWLEEVRAFGELTEVPGADWNLELGAISELNVKKMCRQRSCSMTLRVIRKAFGW